MTTVRPGPSMYSFSSCEQLLFLLDHLQQRLQRAARSGRCRVVEQRRGAVDVHRAVVGQIGERRRRQPHRAGEQRVVQQPLFVDPLEHRLARAMQRQAGELGVEVVRRLAQIVGARAARRASITFWMTWPPRATMTTSTRAPLSGMNSTRSKTAASCAGRSANPTLREACDSTCDTCDSSESSRRSGLSRRSRASTAVAVRLAASVSSSRST